MPKSLKKVDSKDELTICNINVSLIVEQHAEQSTNFFEYTLLIPISLRNTIDDTTCNTSDDVRSNEEPNLGFWDRM